MGLQELIEQSELDLSLGQVKAFMLGVLTSEDPLSFPEALDELMTEAPGARRPLEPHLQQLWKELNNKDNQELANLFLFETEDVRSYLTEAQERLDYFLTGLSLAGTSSEDAEGELGEMLEELEATLEDLDDFVADEKAQNEKGEEIRENLLACWEALVELKS
jgi:uncharacterized protein YgfB (UPF0149 family)